jgi:hypothetical protein
MVAIGVQLVVGAGPPFHSSKMHNEVLRAQHFLGCFVPDRPRVPHKT